MQWHGVELSNDNLRMVYIPVGFAHGFQALTDNAKLIYHHSECYSPEYERGLDSMIPPWRSTGHCLQVLFPLKIKVTH